jgi:hypothetical protein
MNMKKAVRKIVALGAGATFLGATMAGAMAATTLAEYPAPFVKDGKFMGKIIVGANAATSDVLGAIDIAASLQEASSTDVDTGTGGTTTTLLGDAVSVSKSNDLLELNESIGDVRESLTEIDLAALRGGSLSTDQGTTDYTQYLRFERSTAPLLTSPRVIYAANDASDKEVGDWLFVDTDGDAGTAADAFFEYEIVFADGLESDIQQIGSTGTYDLRDIENEVVNVFGSDFVIVDTSFVQGELVTINLLGGDVVDTLREGETKTYTIDGQDYEVTAVFISDATTPSVKFSVNSQLTDELEESDTDKLQGGLEIGVQDILTNQRDGIVEFYLGANKIELKDNSSDTSFNSGSGAGVTIQTENIEEGLVQISGAYTSGAGVTSAKYEITSIKYRLVADANEDIFVPPGHGVREYLDEPEGMLNPLWDLRYEGLIDTTSTPIIIDGSDEQYELTVTNIQNQIYNIELYGTPSGSSEDIRAGSASNTADESLIWVEPIDAYATTGSSNLTNASLGTVTNVVNVYKDDYFVVSDIGVASTATTGFDKNAVSNVLHYDSIDTSDRKLTFTDEAGGTVTTTYDSYTTGAGNVIGTGTLRVAGNDYLLYVSNQTTDYPLAIDLNGDGDIDGDFAHFTVKGGGVLVLGNETDRIGRVGGAGSTASQVTMTLYSLTSEFDEAPAANEALSWEIGASAGDVTLTDPTTNMPADGGGDTAFLTSPDDNDEHKFGATLYGVLVDVYDPDSSNAPSELTMDYPMEQRGAQVFVTAGAVESSKSTTGDGKAKKINPIGIGLATLDKDAPAIGSTPMLVVGVPCANTVAAELMGNPVDCLTGFQTGKAMIKLYADKNALLVAGMDAVDTQGASYVLADYGQYDLTGTEVEVTVTSLDDIRVTPMG